MEKYEDNFIVAPLDINNFAGAAEGRLGPWLICLSVGLGPLIFVPYLLQFLPLLAICIPELIWFLFILAYTVGDHRNRVAKFKKSLEDEYSSSYDLLNVKKMWDTGCIEYVTRKVAYMIVCESAERLSDEEMSVKLEALYRQFFNKKYKVSIYFQNVEISKELTSRYKLAKNFADREARDDYIKILDHNIQLATTKSLLMRTVILVSGRRHEFKDILAFVKEGLGSSAVRVFKNVKLVTDQEEIEEIFSRDLDTYINYMDLMRRKYKTGKYYGSKIVGYDIVDEEIIEKKENNIRGFMVR